MPWSALVHGVLLASCRLRAAPLAVSVLQSTDLLTVCKSFMLVTYT